MRDDLGPATLVRQSAVVLRLGELLLSSGASSFNHFAAALAVGLLAAMAAARRRFAPVLAGRVAWRTDLETSHSQV